MTHPSIESAYADLEHHRIEGFYRDGRKIQVPLISEIEANLWTGGCRDGARLPDDFTFVLSLYKWEQYELAADTRRLEVRMYDCGDIPEPQQLYDLAELVNARRERGKVLVHCQAGLNRSGLVAGLALHLAGMTAADAVALMREKRSPMVLCNTAFEEWLLERDDVARKAA